MFRNLKMVAFLVACSLLFSILLTDYAYAVNSSSYSVDTNDSKMLKKGAIGALVVLGIVGVYKWIKNENQEEYQDSLARAKVYLEQEDYQLAIKYLTKASRVENTIEVERLLYDAKNKYKAHHYQLGLDYLEEEAWEAAYFQFEKVIEYDPDYLDLRSKYKTAYQKLKEIKAKRIAVIDFADATYRYNLAGKATSLFTAQLLEREPEFIEVIERSQLNQIIAEQKLVESGFLDLNTAQELGNILGVDYLVVAKVLSGSVSHDEDYEYITTWEDEEKKRYNLKKEAYTQIVFKLLSVSDASIELSKKVVKKSRFSEYYYRGDSIIIPTDEEMIDQVLTEAVDEFAQMIYEEYEY